mgnify:CR=1 FL=1
MNVSVIIPVFNAVRFLEAAVKSALAVQEVAEVVLVDDGSSDGSQILCDDLAKNDARISCYRHLNGLNKGVSASRNLGIELAKHEYIAFLDADDLFVPDRFAMDRKLFQEHPDADGVYGAIGVHYYDDQGREMFGKVFSSELTTVRVAVPPERLFEVFMGVGAPIHDFGNFSLDGFTVKKSALDKMPLLLREGMAMHEDSEFIVRMSYYLRLYAGSIDRAVALRGVHGDNRITANARSARRRWQYNKFLLKWAEREGVDQRVIKSLKAQVIFGAVKSASTKAEKRSATKQLLTSPSQWKKVDTIHAWFDLMFGAGSRISYLLKRISYLLYAILWKLKGISPPIPTPTRIA